MRTFLAAMLLSFSPQLQVQEAIRCHEGYCLVPISYLERLVSEASAAREYAALCGWVK